MKMTLRLFLSTSASTAIIQIFRDSVHTILFLVSNLFTRASFQTIGVAFSGYVAENTLTVKYILSSSLERISFHVKDRREVITLKKCCSRIKSDFEVVFVHVIRFQNNEIVSERIDH